MFKKTATLVDAKATSLKEWRKYLVASTIKQDPAMVEALSAFDLDKENFIYVRARAISCLELHGFNQNGDGFETSELEKSYRTFIRRGVFLNHQSDDPAGAIGIIIDAVWHPKAGYVECLMAIDRKEDVAQKIASGIAQTWSMGVLVSECECSECHKKCTDEANYCNCLSNYLGRDYNGKKVGAINRGLNFYELSNVTIPADPKAYTLQVWASKKDEPRLSAHLVKIADSYAQYGESKPDCKNCTHCGCHKDADVVAKVNEKLAAHAAPIKEEKILNAVRRKLAVVRAPLLPVKGEVRHRIQAALDVAKVVDEKLNKKIAENMQDPMEGLIVNNNLTVRYLPGETLEDCYFIARKGQLQAIVSAAKVLSPELKTAILSSEKVSKTAAEKATQIKDDSKPIPDTHNKPNAGGAEQPMKEVNPLSAVPAKEIKDDSKPGHDGEIGESSDPIQPSDVVKKYAQLLGATNITFKTGRDGSFTAYLSGGSITRLAGFWSTSPVLVRKAKLDNEPNIAREHALPEKTDMTDKVEIAREDKSKEAVKPSGSLGKEQKAYFQTLDSKNHSEGGGENWARKVAELTKSAAEYKKQAEALKIENDTLKKALEATKMAAIEEKKAVAIKQLVSVMEKMGSIRVDAEELMDLQEKGLQHSDAQVKAFSNAMERKRAELKQLDLKALNTMLESLSSIAPMQLKQASLELPVSGRDESIAVSDEDILAQNW